MDEPTEEPTEERRRRIERADRYIEEHYAEAMKNLAER